MMSNKAEQFEPVVLVNHIDSFGKGLKAWDVKFIASMIDEPPKHYTTNMIKQIHRIYDETC